MADRGRKSWKEELKIKQRYSALTEPYFRVLMKFLKSEDKSDQKFAVTEISKAFVKMIPQSIDGGEDKNGNPIPLLYGIYSHDSNKENSTAQEEA